MNEMKFGDLKRVNKPTARRLFMDGQSVTICPCNMRPIGIWGMGAVISKKEADDTFDRIVNAFEYYNCNAETGYYASFYIRE